MKIKLAINLFIIYLCINTGFACSECPTEDHLTYNNEIDLSTREEVKNIVPGKTTLKDVHKIFSCKETKRMTFKKILKKYYKNQLYNVKRIVVYESGITGTNPINNGAEYMWLDRYFLTFFLDEKDIVLFYTIRHNIRDEHMNSILGKYDTIGKIDGAEKYNWPKSLCDTGYYDVYNRGKVFGEPVISKKSDELIRSVYTETHHCDWVDDYFKEKYPDRKSSAQ